MQYPIAVRSSALLEDSMYQPLAGMYATYMLPNTAKNKETRFNQLCEAIKRVYASTYFQEPKTLLKNSIQQREEEKMGVILMELIGQKHGSRFYPTLSGTAQSLNYYPVSYMKRDEGIATIALGAIGDVYMQKGNVTDAFNYYEKAYKRRDNELTTPMFMMKAAFSKEMEEKYDEAKLLYQEIIYKYQNSPLSVNAEKYLESLKLGAPVYQIN